MSPPLAGIVEAALLTAGRPLSLKQLERLFAAGEVPSRDELRQALDEIATSWEGRCLELVEVGSGYRLQARSTFRPWLARLSEERPARYSRATLETLAVIVYRQPVTRAVIEEVRGVSVGSSIMRTLLEREWIRIVGHRDVPGKPALYGTTKRFLDDFNLRSLNELPALDDILPGDHAQKELDLQAALEAAVVEPEAEAWPPVAETVAEDVDPEVVN